MPKRSSSHLCESKEAHSPVDEDDYTYESDHEDEHASVERYVKRAKMGDDEEGEEDDGMHDDITRKEAQHRTTRVLQYGGHPR